jgi:hypothetical protein
LSVLVQHYVKTTRQRINVLFIFAKLLIISELSVLVQHYVKTTRQRINILLIFAKQLIIRKLSVLVQHYVKTTRQWINILLIFAKQLIIRKLSVLVQHYVKTSRQQINDLLILAIQTVFIKAEDIITYSYSSICNGTLHIQVQLHLFVSWIRWKIHSNWISIPKYLWYGQEKGFYLWLNYWFVQRKLFQAMYWNHKGQILVLLWLNQIIEANSFCKKNSSDRPDDFSSQQNSMYFRNFWWPGFISH